MSVYHQVLTGITQKLNADNRFQPTIARFKASNDPVEKFRCIEELRRDGCFQHPQIQQPRIPKNNGESVAHRTLGNRYYELGTKAGYLAALQHYNKSICYAENGSQDLGLAYGNRSAAYFDLGLYDDCIRNVHLAKQTAPHRVLEKLNAREADCDMHKAAIAAALAQAKKPSAPPESPIEPKLSFPPHPKIPFIANCLKLSKNARYGRHITTKIDLKPGDVVAIEEAFCSKLLPKFRYVRCDNCLRENNFNLMPCTSCASVMFCEGCRDEAYEKFHKIECPIIDFIDKLLCESGILDFRKIVRAITSFESVDALIAFVDETKGQQLSVFDINYMDPHHKVYAPVHFMAENIRPEAELAVYVSVALIAQPLLELTELKDKFDSEEAVTVLKELVLNHMNRSSIQHSPSVYFDGKLFDEYATGVYPFRDLLNHACDANLKISSTDRKMVYTVKKPVRAGEQLFDNYEVNFRYMGLEERQRTLKNFVCKCKACEHNYPLEQDARSRFIDDLKVIRPVSRDSLKVCADYLYKYDRYYPCKQLLYAEQEFHCQLEVIYNTEESMESRYTAQNYR